MIAPYDEGEAAARAGVPWWINPYPPGSDDSDAWDHGHTTARLAADRATAAQRRMIDE